MSAVFEQLTGFGLRDPWLLGCLALLPLAFWLGMRRGAAAILPSCMRIQVES